MNLYVFEIRGIREIGHAEQRHHPKFKITMEGDRGDDEGTWSAGPEVLRHLGQARGTWKTMTRWGEILFSTHNPGAFDYYFRDVPFGRTLLMLEDVDALGWPLFVGQGSKATLYPNYIQTDLLEANWRVVSRGF